MVATASAATAPPLSTITGQMPQAVVERYRHMLEESRPHLPLDTIELLDGRRRLLAPLAQFTFPEVEKGTMLVDARPLIQYAERLGYDLCVRPVPGVWDKTGVTWSSSLRITK